MKSIKPHFSTSAKLETSAMVTIASPFFVKRPRLTKLQELMICDHRRNQPDITLCELAVWTKTEFTLSKLPSRKMIARILRSETTLRLLSADCLDRRAIRPRHQLQVDECVVEFVTACESMQLALSGGMIIARAQWALHRLNIPRASWPRLGGRGSAGCSVATAFIGGARMGEGGVADLGAVEEDVQNLRNTICSYSFADVYNMDETSFFYNNVPRGSLCINNAPSLKQDKSRLTLAVCTNATGTDKMPLLFAGKAFKPRWLQNRPADTLYASTPRAWMTSDTFQGWLRDVDEPMRAQRRHILLLVDNAYSHSCEGVVLSNVRVVKLSPNTTAKLQPLDQGIIYCLKRAVLRKKMEFALDALDEGLANPYKVGALKAIEWCAEAWRELPASTIEHCWLHSKLIAKTDVNFLLH